ncbi:MAG: ABC transporter permease [Planctomycetia bacterium]|nr:ABC transporter permease [Planctomycetia bacterium]
MTAYAAEIWRLRHFWLALVRVDLRKCYRHTTLGLGWSLLHPIAMTVVLCTVFSKLFNADIRTYAPFLLSGLTLWNFMTAVMTQGCQSFFQGESYIRQHPAPLAIYPLRATLGTGIHLLLGLGVVLVFVWCFRGLGNIPALVSLLPTMLLIFVFAWSLAICMGVVNVLFQDTQHLIQVLLQVLFYVTPVMYPADVLRERKLSWVVTFNPFSAFLELVRLPMVEARFPPLSSYAVALATTVLVAAGAFLLLSRYERRMIFYL